jgi:hypothetical protein
MARSNEAYDSATRSSSLRSTHTATPPAGGNDEAHDPRCDRSRRAGGAHRSSGQLRPDCSPVAFQTAPEHDSGAMTPERLKQYIRVRDLLVAWALLYLFKPQLDTFFAPIPHKEFITAGIIVFGGFAGLLSERRKEQEEQKARRLREQWAS